MDRRQMSSLARSDSYLDILRSCFPVVLLKSVKLTTLFHLVPESAALYLHIPVPFRGLVTEQWQMFLFTAGLGWRNIGPVIRDVAATFQRGNLVQHMEVNYAICQVGLNSTSKF
jgi:hypothetical protein